MRRPVSFFAAAAIVAAGYLTASSARSGDEKGKGGPPAPQAPGAEGMKRWMDSCTPGAGHKWLERFLGTWETSMKLVSEGSGMGGGEPSKGTATFRWQSPGRWLAQETKGSMMGMPVEGFGLLGYDNFKQKYVSTWVDSMTTTMLRAEGGLDRSGNVLLAYGTMDEPMTGEHDKMVKYVWRFVDAKTMVFEVHDLPIGETDTKVIEITYTRK